eukprot:CAMPEP_0114501104 /NCGR_PEP_ID=MMETSP0109-20121206/8321_1 /TAXON_ID=29199 /ORGANISM="Chlorarachnion reptans, Strain CCCM449" /LENGTH=980 /DNA_ID=CAMNT_0001678813 /DNA_START=24 /DNA_END=2963 /DNA_ORIENTATION=-
MTDSKTAIEQQTGTHLHNAYLSKQELKGASEKHWNNGTPPQVLNRSTPLADCQIDAKYLKDARHAVLILEACIGKIVSEYACVIGPIVRDEDSQNKRGQFLRCTRMVFEEYTTSDKINKIKRLLHNMFEKKIKFYESSGEIKLCICLRNMPSYQIMEMVKVNFTDEQVVLYLLASRTGRTVQMVLKGMINFDRICNRKPSRKMLVVTPEGNEAVIRKVVRDVGYPVDLCDIQPLPTYNIEPNGYDCILKGLRRYLKKKKRFQEFLQPSQKIVFVTSSTPRPSLIGKANQVGFFCARDITLRLLGSGADFNSTSNYRWFVIKGRFTDRTILHMLFVSMANCGIDILVKSCEPEGTFGKLPSRWMKESAIKCRLCHNDRDKLDNAFKFVEAMFKCIPGVIFESCHPSCSTAGSREKQHSYRIAGHILDTDCLRVLIKILLKASQSGNLEKRVNWEIAGFRMGESKRDNTTMILRVNEDGQNSEAVLRKLNTICREYGVKVCEGDELPRETGVIYLRMKGHIFRSEILKEILLNKSRSVEFIFPGPGPSQETIMILKCPAGDEADIKKVCKNKSVRYNIHCNLIDKDAAELEKSRFHEREKALENMGPYFEFSLNRCNAGDHPLSALGRRFENIRRKAHERLGDAIDLRVSFADETGCNLNLFFNGDIFNEGHENKLNEALKFMEELVSEEVQGCWCTAALQNAGYHRIPTLAANLVCRRLKLVVIQTKTGVTAESFSMKLKELKNKSVTILLAVPPDLKENAREIVEKNPGFKLQVYSEPRKHPNSSMLDALLDYESKGNQVKDEDKIALIYSRNGTASGMCIKLLKGSDILKGKFKIDVRGKISEQFELTARSRNRYKSVELYEDDNWEIHLDCTDTHCRWVLKSRKQSVIGVTHFSSLSYDITFIELFALMAKNEVSCLTFLSHQTTKFWKHRWKLEMKEAHENENKLVQIVKKALPLSKALKEERKWMTQIPNNSLTVW